MTLDEVSKGVDRDVSTAFRSLQKLVTLGLNIKISSDEQISHKVHIQYHQQNYRQIVLGFNNTQP